MLLLLQHTNFGVVLILSSMKDMEWVLLNPSVDMTVEDLANLRWKLKKRCKEPNRSSCSWAAKCPWHHKWNPQITRSCQWVLLESNMVQRAYQSRWNSDDGNDAWNLPGKSNDIWERYSNYTDDYHAFYLFQEILQTIIGCIDNAHTKYEADCLDWQSVINDGNELLCKADMLQFKELCNNNHMLCKDEYHLYKEWTQVMEARPRYVSIMYIWITDKDEQAWNKDYNWFFWEWPQAGIFPGTSPDVGPTSVALLLPRGSHPFLKLQGK